MQGSAPLRHIVRFGVFEVDLRAGELRKNGLKLKIQEQPFHVLAMLLEHPGEIVTREEIQKKLWPEDTFVDFGHGLNAAINKLREALGDSADNPRFVETLARRGYRFIYPVAPVSPPAAFGDGDIAATGAGAHGVRPDVGAGPRARPSEGAHRGTPLQRHWVVAASVAAVVATLAALLALNVAGVRERLLRQVGAIHEPPLQIHSIAVLPLDNLSGDPNQEYIADGMTDELITNLGKISALRVISRQSTMRYKGSKKPLPEIARELNVDALVEGTVLRSGDRVRITANLLHAPADRHLWAESYERDLRDVLALQGEVAHAIAEEVRIKLTPQEQVRLASTRPVNPEAYEAYLKGRYFHSKFPVDAEKAPKYFQEAIDKDPNYGEAWAGLANSTQLLGYFNPPYQFFAKAKAAAEKALQLNPTLGEAHLALGEYKAH